MTPQYSHNYVYASCRYCLLEKMIDLGTGSKFLCCKFIREIGSSSNNTSRAHTAVHQLPWQRCCKKHKSHIHHLILSLYIQHENLLISRKFHSNGRHYTPWCIVSMMWTMGSVRIDFLFPGTWTEVRTLRCPAQERSLILASYAAADCE